MAKFNNELLSIRKKMMNTQKNIFIPQHKWGKEQHFMKDKLGQKT